jgi:putative pyruvate formate lyase activating enzyme
MPSEPTLCLVGSVGFSPMKQLTSDLQRLASQAAAAQVHLVDCQLCPHGCGPARSHGCGACRVGQRSYIASEMIHLGEELPLRPAHAIFFSGCTATCSFCTAARFAFRPTYGVAVVAAQLAQRILQRQEKGARSVCFIGGDPAPHIPFILETLAVLGSHRRIPAVFNSNFYLTETALDLLEGAIDLYLPDLKFGPATGPAGCGEQLGGMPDYWNTVTGAIDRLYQAGNRLLVRHLLMPGHFHCCTEPVLQWLAQRPGIQVSLLAQYLAPAHARGELARPLAQADVDQARELARELDLDLVA